MDYTQSTSSQRAPKRSNFCCTDGAVCGILFLCADAIIDSLSTHREPLQRFVEGLSATRLLLTTRQTLPHFSTVATVVNAKADTFRKPLHLNKPKSLETMDITAMESRTKLGLLKHICCDLVGARERRMDLCWQRKLFERQTDADANARMLHHNHD